MKIGLPARIAILGATLFCEKIFLGGFVNSQAAQAARGFGAFVRFAQHWGFRFAVTFFGALVVIAFVRGGDQLSAAAADIGRWRISPLWIVAHFFLVACLIPLSFLLYGSGTSPPLFVGIAVLGLLFGLAAAWTALSAMAPWACWLRAARALGVIWGYAAIAAVLGVAAMEWSQKLWAPTAGMTFNLVSRLLRPILPTLSADVATRVLSTDRFSVEVTEVCSGLEGMGLILAFTAAWLICFRREYIFPRALLLIPAGILTMFALNSLRIAALMLIGNGGYPNVALYGFHSQAGWIAFNAAACGLVFLSRRSAWLSRDTAPASGAATDNPTATYLMPLLAVIAAGILSNAMSGQFETFYPLRLILGLAALLLYGGKLARLDWRFSWRGPALGVLVFLLWMGCAHFLVPSAAQPLPLLAMSPAMRLGWIASRLAASVLIVPIAEELAYRGYLMRRLVNEDFEAVSYASIRWPALAASAVIFGLAHGALWLPGIAAGLAFGLLVMRRGSLGEALAAHATSNALVAVSVLGFDQWQLW